MEKKSLENASYISNDALQLKIKLKGDIKKEFEMLDFRQRKMTSLKEFEPFIPQLSKHLRYLYLERNSLTTIQQVNQFTGLKILKAGGNYLSSVNLSLDSLQELRLQQNHLNELPDLRYLTALKILDVSKNPIYNLRMVSLRLNHEIPQNKLEFLDFSGNSIKGPEKWAITQFENVLEKYKKLERLLYKPKKQNCKNSHPLELTHYLPAAYVHDMTLLPCTQCLVKINCMDRYVKDGYWRCQEEGVDCKEDWCLNCKKRNDEEMQWEIKRFPACLQKINGKTTGNQHMHVVQRGQPNLLQMSRLLKIALNDPNPINVLEFLIELQVMAEKTKDSQFSHSQFKKGISEDEQSEKVEAFVHNAQVLADNNHDYRPYILKVLVQLTCVREYDILVKRCFGALQNMYQEGHEIAEQIIEILKKDVIQQINNSQSEWMKMNSLLQGLFCFIDYTEQGQLLSPLLNSFFWKVIKKIDANKNEKQWTLKILEDNYLVIFKLIALAIKNGEKQDIIEFHRQNLKFILRVYSMWNDFDKNSEFYLEILKILTHSAMQVKNIASLVLNNRNANFSISLKRRMNKLKINQSFVPSDKGNQSMLDVGFFSRFSAEIETLSALMNSEDKERVEQILSEKDDQCPNCQRKLQINQHIPHSKKRIPCKDCGKEGEMASCTMCDFDRCKECMENHFLYKLIFLLSSPEQVDPMLLASICKLALAMLRQNIVKKVPETLQNVIDAIDSCNQLLPYLGMDKYEQMQKIAQKYEGSTTNYVRGEFKSDENKVCHEVFISIIRLVTFFCEGENSNPLKHETDSFMPARDAKKLQEKLKKKYSAVNTAMNENGREMALFNCLEIPSDDVKLAVVQCLFNVSVEQLDNEEINILIRHMRSCSPGQGQNELILSHIFWIFCKFYKNDYFKVQLSDAVTAGLSILKQNQKRVVEDRNEMKEKYILSTTIVSFLRLMSQRQDKKYKWDYRVLKKVLFSEQKLTQDLAYRLVPIVVEDTELGKTMDLLLDLIIVDHKDVQKSLQPYNYVSFRLLHRMANLLSHVKSKEPFHQFHKNKPQKIMSEMSSYYKKDLRIKILEEKGLWSSMDDAYIQTDLRSTESINFKELLFNHDYFTNKRSQDGIYHLITFLSSKNKEDEIWLNENSQDLELSLYSRQEMILDKVQKVSHQEKKQMQLGSQFLEKQQKILMTQYLRDEVLGTGYEEFRHQQKQCQPHPQPSLKKKADLTNENLNIKNQEMRVINVAALLRILYSSIQNAPTKQLSDQAINNLSESRFFEDLLKLCNSTGWFEGNIGVKFLMIMRFTLKVEHRSKSIPESEYTKYLLYAQVAKQVLIKLNEGMLRQTRLAPEDYLLINQITTLCEQLCQQCCFFQMFSHKVAAPIKLDDKHTHGEKKKEILCIKGTEFECSVNLYFEKLAVRLENMFPFSVVKTLIAIIFQDMEQAYRKQSGKEEVEEDQKFYYEVNDAKVSTREHIKNFLGRLLALSSKEMRFKIIEHISNQIIFQKKVMRKSIYNEMLILSQQERSIRHLTLQYFEDTKSKIRFNLWEDKNDLISHQQETGINGKVIQLQIWSSSRISSDEVGLKHQASPKTKVGENADLDQYFTRYMMLSNRGIYIFNDGSMPPCENCNQSNLCPAGGKPVLIFSFKYTQIDCVRKFSLSVQKMFITFKVTKGSCSWHQYEKYFNEKLDENSQETKLITLAIIFHRINGAFTIQTTMDGFMNYEKVRHSHFQDFTLEYSLYYNGVQSFKKSEKIAFNLKYNLIQPQIVRYVCYFESRKALKQYSSDEQNKNTSKLTYECVPQEQIKQKNGKISYRLPHMLILVISAHRLMLFKEKNSMWMPYTSAAAKASLKNFRKDMSKSEADPEDKKSGIDGHLDYIKKTASNFTEEVKSFPLSDLLEINSPNDQIPSIDLVFNINRECMQEKEKLTLVFVGDLSKEQVLSLLIELKSDTDSDDAEISF